MYPMDPERRSHQREYEEPETCSQREEYEEPETCSQREEYEEPETCSQREEYEEPETCSHQREYEEPETCSQRKEYGEPETCSHQREYGEPETCSQRREYGEPETCSQQREYGEPERCSQRREYREPSSGQWDYGLETRGNGQAMARDLYSEYSSMRRTREDWEDYGASSDMSYTMDPLSRDWSEGSLRGSAAPFSPDTDGEVDGDPVELSVEDLELLRNRMELEIIEEQNALKKAVLAMELVGPESKAICKQKTKDKDLEVLTTNDSNKDVTLKERVNCILRKRAWTNECRSKEAANQKVPPKLVLHPPKVVKSFVERMNESNLHKDSRLKGSLTLDVHEEEHPLKLKVEALLAQRHNPTANKEDKAAKGFQHFLDVLNKGVDIDRLSKIVNNFKDLPSMGEELPQGQPPPLHGQPETNSKSERKMPSRKRRSRFDEFPQGSFNILWGQPTLLGVQPNPFGDLLRQVAQAGNVLPQHRSLLQNGGGEIGQHSLSLGFIQAMDSPKNKKPKSTQVEETRKGRLKSKSPPVEPKGKGRHKSKSPPVEEKRKGRHKSKSPPVEPKGKGRLKSKSPPVEEKRKGRLKSKSPPVEEKREGRLKSKSPPVEPKGKGRLKSKSPPVEEKRKGRLKSMSPQVEEKRKMRPEDEQKYGQIQSLLQTVGLDLGVEELGRLNDRIQERLYGKKRDLGKKGGKKESVWGVEKEESEKEKEESEKDKQKEKEESEKDKQKEKEESEKDKQEEKEESEEDKQEEKEESEEDKQEEKEESEEDKQEEKEESEEDKQEEKEESEEDKQKEKEESEEDKQEEKEESEEDKQEEKEESEEDKQEEKEESEEDKQEEKEESEEDKQKEKEESEEDKQEEKEESEEDKQEEKEESEEDKQEEKEESEEDKQEEKEESEEDKQEEKEESEEDKQEESEEDKQEEKEESEEDKQEEKEESEEDKQEEKEESEEDKQEEKEESKKGKDKEESACSSKCHSITLLSDSSNSSPPCHRWTAKYKRSSTRDQDRDRDRGRSERDRDRRSSTRDQDRDRDRGRSERNRDRRSSTRDQDRERYRDRDRSERDRDRRSSTRDQDRERDRGKSERDRDRRSSTRDQDRERDRDRGRSERDRGRSERDRDRRSSTRDQDRERYRDRRSSTRDQDRERYRDRRSSTRDQDRERDGGRSERDRHSSTRELDRYRWWETERRIRSSTRDGDREWDRSRSERDRLSSTRDRPSSTRDRSEKDGDGDRSERDKDRERWWERDKEWDGDKESFHGLYPYSNDPTHPRASLMATDPVQYSQYMAYHGSPYASAFPPGCSFPPGTVFPSTMPPSTVLPGTVLLPNPLGYPLYPNCPPSYYSGPSERFFQPYTQATGNPPFTNMDVQVQDPNASLSIPEQEIETVWPRLVHPSINQDSKPAGLKRLSIKVQLKRERYRINLINRKNIQELRQLKETPLVAAKEPGIKKVPEGDAVMEGEKLHFVVPPVATTYSGAPCRTGFPNRKGRKGKTLEEKGGLFNQGLSMRNRAYMTRWKLRLAEAVAKGLEVPSEPEPKTAPEAKDKSLTEWQRLFADSVANVAATDLSALSEPEAEKKPDWETEQKRTDEEMKVKLKKKLGEFNLKMKQKSTHLKEVPSEAPSEAPT